MDLVFQVNGVDVPRGMRPDKIQPKETEPTGQSLRSQSVGFKLSREIWFTWEVLPLSVLQWWDEYIFGHKKTIEADSLIFPSLRVATFALGDQAILSHAKWDKVVGENFILNGVFDVLNDHLAFVGQTSIKFRQVL